MNIRRFVKKAWNHFDRHVIKDKRGVNPFTGPFLGLFGGDDDGGGGGFDFSNINSLQDLFNIIEQLRLLSPEQRQQAIQGLFRFQDFPDSPLGIQGRDVLSQRLSDDFIPRLFRPESLNPFVQSQFRLGREQVGEDIESLEAQLQRQGAFFTPDLTQLSQGIRDEQGLREQDFLSNLLFRGGELAEGLKTDALGRAFGLEQQTASVLDQLLGRDIQSGGLGLGLINSIFGGGAAGAFPGQEQSSFGGQSLAALLSIFGAAAGGPGGAAAGATAGNFLSSEELDFQNRLNEFLGQQQQGGLSSRALEQGIFPS